MKTGLTRLAVLVLAVTGNMGPGMSVAKADLEVSAAVHISAAVDFYEPLTPDGVWVEVGGYGRCWHPAGVAVGWRPYCDGTWVWTDCGWYWQSDEPWAWACYHYGSWIFDPVYGWVWIPGVEWAPAWVYWRLGGGYIGWAPCAPRGGAIRSSAFVFVDEHHFHERHRPATVIVDNPIIFNNTKQSAGDKHEHRIIGSQQQTVVVNNGPEVKVVEKSTGRKFTAVSVREADRHTAVPSAVKQKQSEPPAETKTPAVHEQTKPAPEHKVAPPQHPPDSGFSAPGTEGKDNRGQGHENNRDKDR